MSQDTSSSEEKEGPCMPCEICGCTDSTDWDCKADGFECFVSKNNSHYLLKTWVEPLIKEPFRHCHEGDTFHVYGKLDADHDLFPLFWEEFTRDNEDDNQCPQCKCKDLCISSEVFYQGHFEVQSFKCYVCSRGCVTCYVAYHMSGMAASMMLPDDSFFQALNAVSRIDLSEADTPFLGEKRKRKAEHEEKEKGNKKTK